MRDPVVEEDLAIIAKNNEPLFHKLDGKTLLVTGGAGFLGAYFVELAAYWNEKYAKTPCQIYCMDTHIVSDAGRLSYLKGRPYFHDLEQSILQPLPAGLKPDYILHCASIASPIFYRKYPIETMDANVLGTRNLLDYAKSNKIESMLFFSTSEVYGDPPADKIPTSEDYRGNVSCTGPRACYDESKRFGETMCINFHQVHQVPVKIARPFNVYGPGMRITDRRVLPDFFRDAFDGKDIVMLSDGKATRSFCYVADGIDGFMKILLCEFNAMPFNIGNDAEEVSMSQTAQEVCHLFGDKNKVVYQISEDKHYLTDNPQRRCPNLARAREKLNYKPRVMLKEGLARLKSWYERNR
ncbi:GDP-L-fucose synthase [uncultured archaeon]|nr:GDP-L-fucose synthase [uncultured archaeon]